MYVCMYVPEKPLKLLIIRIYISIYRQREHTYTLEALKSP